jgi:hypothetical protein
MNASAIGIDQSEQTILAREISDEALETAAGSLGGMEGAYTLYFCTALDLCPGP